MARVMYLVVAALLLSELLSAQVSAPSFSVKEGFYNDTVSLSLIPDNASDIIFYTTDGSKPSLNSRIYSTPLSITKTTVVKAVSYSGGTFSKVKTKTYFINEHSVLPVFSLSTDSAYFFDPDSGIYVMGRDWKNPNYMQDWEAPIHIEFYETNGSRVLDMDAGAKIYGESSRMWPEKSLAIFARSKYGDGKINCKFFPDLPIDEFENFLLRNGGSDFNQAMFRDAYVQTLVRNLNIDVTAYRPSIVFLNGQYWGIHNIREKSDEHYISSHSGYSVDSIDLNVYWNAWMEYGDDHNFSSLRNFMFTADFTKKAAYDSVKKRIDNDAWLNYLCTEIITDNYDWPDNNVKSWCARVPGAKFRWILWDTDCSYDLRLRDSYNRYSIDSSLTRRPDWATQFFRAYLKNADFQIDFINRFADLSNTIFTKENQLKVLNEFVIRIEPEMPRHFARWDDTLARWYKHINVIKTFINERHPYIRDNFIKYFHLSGTYNLGVNINDSSGGIVNLNSLYLNTFPWTGEYFKNIPITLTVKPSHGYIFKRWEGISGAPDSASVTIAFSSDTSITAIFEKDEAYKDIVINEINYNSAPDFDTEDWLELYNAEGSDVDISGWHFTDSDTSNHFIIPQGTVIKSQGYLVLCRDKNKFLQLFNTAGNVMGDFAFGLDNAGECICLTDKNNKVIDSLTYDDNVPWNSLADGTGKTLELKNPKLINNEAQNWSVSLGHGTPGRMNSTFDDLGIPVIPENFLLYQNYPNPFNSGTVIRYGLHEDSNVRIRIYNILGELAAEFLNTQVNKGMHNLNFNPVNFSSGVYFYSVEATEISTGKHTFEVKKMLHLK